MAPGRSGLVPLRIIVAAGTCRLAVLAEGVRLGDAELATNTDHELKLLQPVEIGATAFVVGPPDTDWIALEAALDSLAANRTERTPQVVEPAPDGPAATDPAATVASTAPPDRPDLVADRLVLPASAPAPPFRRIIWIASGCAIVAAVILVAVAILARQSPLPLPPAGDPLTRARTVIHDLHLSDVEARIASGRLVVSGYTATGDEAATLDGALRRAGIDADVQVTAQTALTDMAGTVLRAFGLGVIARSEGPGRLLLTGYADSTTRLDDALRRLNTDVSGLRGITDRVVTPERAAAALQQAVIAAGLADAVKVSPASRSIRVSGFLDQPRMAQWAGVAERFQQEYGSLIPLDARLVSVTSAMPRGIHLGPDAYMVLADGTRLHVGDNLGNTGKIVGIYADRLRVRTAAGDVDLPFAQQPNWILEDKP